MEDCTVNNVTTVSPLYSWANKFRELFKNDTDIKMSFDEHTKVIDMEVSNQIKMLAISYLVGDKKEFPEGTITINVKLANQFGGDKYLTDIVYAAFKGNKLFEYMYSWENPDATTNPMCWVTMSDKLVFYPESNLHHIYGDTVAIPETLAKDVVGDSVSHVFFCTNNSEREIPDHDVREFN